MHDMREGSGLLCLPKRVFPRIRPVLRAAGRQQPATTLQDAIIGSSL